MNEWFFFDIGKIVWYFVIWVGLMVFKNKDKNNVIKVM